MINPVLLKSPKSVSSTANPKPFYQMPLAFGNQAKPIEPRDDDDRFELSPAFDPEHVMYEDPNALDVSPSESPTGEYTPPPPDRMGKLLTDMRNSPHVIQRAEVYQIYLSSRKIHQNPFDQRTTYNLHLKTDKAKGSVMEFWRLKTAAGENIKVRDVSTSLPGAEVFYIDQQDLLPFAFNLRNPVDPITGNIELSGYTHTPFPAYHPVKWGDGLYIDQNFIPLTPNDRPEGQSQETQHDVDSNTQRINAREQMTLYKTLFQDTLEAPRVILYGSDQQQLSIPATDPGFIVVARLLQDERYQQTLIKKHQKVLDSSEGEAKQDVQELVQLAKGYLERSGDHVFYPAEETDRPLHWVPWED